LRSRVGKAAQNKGGEINITSADDRKSAMEDAWLAVEVSDALSFILETIGRGSSGDSKE